MEQELGTWAPLIRGHYSVEEWKTLMENTDAAYRTATIFPPKEKLFSALTLTPAAQVRVIIVGQDPYHEPGQANGLAFSVERGVRLPPSLKNIYKELETDIGGKAPEHGDLKDWAMQGVLLLNTVLTVEAGKANSHKALGWQAFTDSVISATASLPQPIACVLWGSQAQEKEALLKPAAGPRLILKAPHPSPLSAYRGFFGSKPFSQINRFLVAHGEAAIDWLPQK